VVRLRMAPAAVWRGWSASLFSGPAGLAHDGIGARDDTLPMAHLPGALRLAGLPRAGASR